MIVDNLNWRNFNQNFSYFKIFNYPNSKNPPFLSLSLQNNPLRKVKITPLLSPFKPLLLNITFTTILTIITINKQ